MSTISTLHSAIFLSEYLTDWNPVYLQKYYRPLNVQAWKADNVCMISGNLQQKYI